MGTSTVTIPEGYTAIGTGVVTFVPWAHGMGWVAQADPNPANIPANIVPIPWPRGKPYSGDFGSDTVFLHADIAGSASINVNP